MDEKTAKRFSFLINLAYAAVFIALFYLFVRWALPLVAPFLIALVLAALLQRPVNALAKKIKIPKGITGTVLVLLLVAVLATLISVAGVQLVGQLQEFVSFIASKLESIPALITDLQNRLLDWASTLPEVIAGTLTDAISSFSASTLIDDVLNSLTADNIFSALQTPLSGAWSTVKQLPSFMIAVLITIISACFLTKDYDVVRDFILRQFSEVRQTKLRRAKKLVSFSIGKIVKSYLLIILITTCELAIGLSVLKLFGFYNSGYIIGISLLIAIIDIVPVLGTGTVLIPWAVISLISGNMGLGIGLIVVYAVISIIRQIIEPKLVAGQFDLPAIVTIASMYIGTKIFGAIGLFLLPLTVIVIKLLADEGIIGFIKTKRSEERRAEEQAGVSPEEIDARFEQEVKASQTAAAAAQNTPGQKLAAFITKAVTERKKQEHSDEDSDKKKGDQNHADE